MRWILPLSFLLLAHCTSAPQPSAEPEVSKMDRSKIQKTIASHRKYLSHCYGKAIMKKEAAKLEGTVFVQFKVGPDGKAFQPQFIPERSTLKDDQLNNCLFAGLTSWDFPVHPEGLELDIRYPFQFKATAPAGMQKKLDQFKNLRSRSE